MGLKKFAKTLPGILFALAPLTGFGINNFHSYGGTYHYGTPYGLYYVENLPKQRLSEKEKEELLYMREEEKLARDVYSTLYRKWRLSIFRNIARSEQRHMDMVGVLIKKYGLKDPVIDRVGVFTNKHIQELYNKLVAEGEKSLIDALKVGALIEELDITDLKKAMANTDNRDIRIVYANLMKGSRNHLRAFTRVLSRFGYSYEPKYLSVGEFESIVSTPIERGFIRNP